MRPSSIQLPNGLTWTGYSRAGEATSFVLSGLASSSSKSVWMFDCGCLVPPTHTTATKRPSHLFLTHTHADHVQALTQLVFQLSAKQNKGTKPMIVYLPAASERAVRAHLQAFYAMVRDDDDSNDKDHDNTKDTNNNNKHLYETITDLEDAFRFTLIPLQCDQTWDLPPCYRIRTVHCHHRKACLGYRLYSRTQTLKAEYRGLDGPALGALARTNGIVLKEWGPWGRPFLTVLGDTTVEVFDPTPELLLCPNNDENQDDSGKDDNDTAVSCVAVECTFLAPHDVDRARRTRHMHWQDLVRTVTATNNDSRCSTTKSRGRTLFLVQHVSRRHSDRVWRQTMWEFNVSSGQFAVHAMLPQPDENNHSGGKDDKKTCKTTKDIKDDDDELSCNCFVCMPP